MASHNSVVTRLSCTVVILYPPHMQALLNMGCCGVFLLTSFIYSFVFGKLQNVEHQVCMQFVEYTLCLFV